MTIDSAWFSRAQQLDLPAVLPVSALPKVGSSTQEWMSVIREDPLLTIHLFRYANKLLASHDISVLTLEHAVSLLGPTRLENLTAQIPFAEEKSASSKGLLRAIGDSLLAASLLKQWFQMRNIPWTEADYWLSLFYDLYIWLGWLMEPEQMENIEFRVSRGENRDQLMDNLVGMPVREFNDIICRYFQLPIIPSEPADQSQIQSFKQSALKFFLPFSHELAFAVRQDWQSETLEALCRKGEVSLGLPEFKLKLKQWVTVAAREYKLSYAAIAARRLVALQPMTTRQHTSEGFNLQDMALVKQLSNQKDQSTEIQPDTTERTEPEDWPEASSIEIKHNTFGVPRENKQTRHEKTPEHSPINLNIQHEIRSQFHNQRNWHSPIEIQKSAIYGLLHGLCLTRLVVLEEKQGLWQTFDSEGCQHHPLFRNLKLVTRSSEILTELSKQARTLWVNDVNRHSATSRLPPPLIAASESESFFLHSFSIGNQITMLLYADASGRKVPLNTTDYQLFREYCADWNTALNKMRP